MAKTSFGEANPWRSNPFSSKLKSPLSKDTSDSHLAEREGFEPSKRIAPFTRFPSVLLQPLGHLSLILPVMNLPHDLR